MLANPRGRPVDEERRGKCRKLAGRYSERPEARGGYLAAEAIHRYDTQHRGGSGPLAKDWDIVSPSFQCG